MEIPQDIKEKAIAGSYTSSPLPELDAVLTAMAGMNLESLLSAEEEDDLSTADRKIHALVIEAKSDAPYHTRPGRLSGIVAGANMKLKEGIENNDMRSLYLFLSVDCYLRIPLADLEAYHSTTPKQKQDLSAQIRSVLEKLKIAAVALPGLPLHEKEWQARGESGILESNIEKAYSFVTALERSGRGFHFNFFLEHLIGVYY
jgi:hypothetical protein